MANPAESEVQNLLPVQAYFDVQGNFQTFIGQNKPFTATISPIQSGLQITNSTINSSVIGGITPAAGNFTTATVLSQPVGATDVVNLLALQSYAAGISWKQPCVAATLANITLSGLQTIDGKAVAAGDRVLVKDQSTAANNGIYLASASAWTRSEDANSWDELICAITFIEYGTQAGGAWFCTAQDGGTLGVTAVNWSQFTTSATYSAGTGLTLTGTIFSITPVGTAGTYGSASTVPVFTTNASGQVSSVTNTNIAIGATQITSGTIDSARLSGSYSGITGLGTLTDLTVTNAIVGSITGNAATATLATSATSATTATNIGGGAAGSVPYQTASSTTGFLAAGTNGQVLTLASGVPSWATPTTGTVTSVSGSGTVSGISLSGTVTSTGSLTLGGTLDLSAPPAIGGTTANTVRGTTVTATSSFVGSFFDAAGSGGGSLRTSGGSACLQWGGGGGVNVTIDGPINMNGANAAIQMNPTGTGTVSIAPAGALTVNPTTASTMNNVAIGGTTPLAGTFTDLRFNGTLSAAGSTGTSGFVMTSNGASAPTWQALPASGITITDDTTTNATRYLAFTSATSGTITGQNVASTKLQFNPSTGFLAPTGVIVGAGTNAAPAITTTGDTNTGIFFPTADAIGFAVGGADSARLSAGLLSISATSSAGTTIRLYEDTDNGTNYVDISAPSVITSDRTITLPDSTGTVSLANYTIQVFTSSGTYTKPAGVAAIKVTVVGGGGGGGSAAANAPGFNSAATGGGGAGTSFKLIPASSVGSTETITIGALGNGGSSGGNGNAGGTSSFGSHCSATGGGAGLGCPSISNAGQNTEGGSTSSGGAGSGGSVNLTGGSGGFGFSFAAPNRGVGGSGGASFLCGGPEGTQGGAISAASTQYGAGGGGGAALGNSPAVSGGNGAAGIIIVEEFY